LRVVSVAHGEPAIRTAKFTERYQFMRKGYFSLDKDSSEEKMVFNRTVTLKDNWIKEQKKN
jgi:glutaminyl-tRNA synthetase